MDDMVMIFVEFVDVIVIRIMMMMMNFLVCFSSF